MNTRRSFLKQLAIGAASFAILPGAKTYERVWRPARGLGRTLWVLNPDYKNAGWIMDIVWHPKAFDITTRGAAVLIPENRYRFHHGGFEKVPKYIEVAEP